MGVVILKAAAITTHPTAGALRNGTGDIALIGAFAYSSSGGRIAYNAAGTSGTTDIIISNAARDEIEGKWAQIARGDYVVIEG